MSSKLYVKLTSVVFRVNGTAIKKRKLESPPYLLVSLPFNVPTRS